MGANQVLHQIGAFFVEVRDSPYGIFNPCALWSRGLARWESSVHVVAAVVVTWKFRSETVLAFGPEPVSYERSRPICRWALPEILARAFFVKPQKYKNNKSFQYFQDIRKFQ